MRVASEALPPFQRAVTANSPDERPAGALSVYWTTCVCPGSRSGKTSVSGRMLQPSGSAVSNAMPLKVSEVGFSRNTLTRRSSPGRIEVMRDSSSG